MALCRDRNSVVILYMTVPRSLYGLRDEDTFLNSWYMSYWQADY